MWVGVSTLMGMAAGRRLTHEEAAAEMVAAGFTPTEPYPGVDKKWHVKCLTCRTTVDRTLSNVRAGKGCKHCKGLIVDPAEATRTMVEAGLLPLVAYPGSNKPWKCRCTVCGEEPTPCLISVRKGHGCKFCARQAVDPAEAERAMLKLGLEPTEPYPGNSRSKWPYRCQNCKEHGMTTLDSVRAGSGCRNCGYERSAAARRLDSAAAEQIMIARGYRPTARYVRRNEPWPARCMVCGKSCSPLLQVVRVGDGYGCAQCRGLIIGEQSAKAVMAVAGLEPAERYPGVHKPWACTCLTCGRAVSPTLANVRRGQGGCRWCARRMVEPAEAAQLMRAHGFEPQGTYPGAANPWPCLCLVCGQPSTPTYNNAESKGTGCRYCAERGFDLAVPAQVYLAAHPSGALKIGVSHAATPNGRLEKHRRHGWSAMRTLYVPTGAYALAVEQQVLASIRSDLDPHPFMTAECMPQGGWTETFDGDLVSLDAAWRLILEAHRRNRSNALTRAAGS